MRRRTQALLMALVLVLLAGCAGETVSPVIAQVGNTYITEEQFTEYMKFQKGYFDQAKTVRTPEQIRQDLFDLMILEEVALSEARRNGAGIDSDSAAKIEAAVNAQVAQDSQAGTKLLTFGDYQNYANKNKFASVETLRGLRARNFALDNYAESVEISTPDATEPVKAYPFIREIVVPVAETATADEAEAAHQRAIQVAAQLKAGAGLGDFVPEFTAIEPQIAQFQGEVGWIDPAGGGPEFEQAANSIPLNQYSDPIRTGLGWHVFQVTKRAQFPSWQTIASSDQGHAYLQGKLDEYKQKGELNYYFDISKIPLPFDNDQQ